MITDAHTGAPAGVALTRLLQIVSPALPIGAFAYSQGLEQAIASGWVTAEADTRDWLLGLLEHAFGTLDLPVLARLLAAWRTRDADAVDRWTAWLQASRPTRETRDEDRQLGAALARTLAGLDVDGAAAWTGRDDVTLAAMFALAAARFEIPTETALTGHAFAWAEAITSAAVRGAAPARRRR
jgi:urease accessory protein